VSDAVSEPGFVQILGAAVVGVCVAGVAEELVGAEPFTTATLVLLLVLAADGYRRVD